MFIVVFAVVLVVDDDIFNGIKKKESLTTIKLYQSGIHETFFFFWLLFYTISRYSTVTRNWRNTHDLDAELSIEIRPLQKKKYKIVRI